MVNFLVQCCGCCRTNDGINVPQSLQLTANYNKPLFENPSLLTLQTLTLNTSQSSQQTIALGGWFMIERVRLDNVIVKMADFNEVKAKPYVCILCANNLQTFAFETICYYVKKSTTYSIYYLVKFETKRVLLKVVSFKGVNFYPTLPVFIRTSLPRIGSPICLGHSATARLAQRIHLRMLNFTFLILRWNDTNLKEWYQLQTGQPTKEHQQDNTKCARPRPGSALIWLLLFNSPVNHDIKANKNHYLYWFIQKPLFILTSKIAIIIRPLWVAELIY